jgi:ATP-dependent protease ClpP protease subunit
MAADLCTERWDWEIDDWSAQNLIKGLYVLDGAAHRPIKLIWFSYGGDWDAGMAIYDFIKHIKSPVDVYAYGRIRSMGTIVLQACRKRNLASNCLFLIHYGSAGQEECHSKDHIAFAREVEKNNKTMEDIYLKRIKEKRKRFTRAQLQDVMKYDKYMTAREAVDLGLADRVIHKR